MSGVRYSRQEQISEWDQSRLAEAKVVVVGAGALGNFVVPALAALGIGEIKIIDFDTIELHNLNRQLMFTEADVGLLKVDALAKRVEERNSGIILIPIAEKITEDNIDVLVGTPDIIIDCVDLIYVRRMLNRYAIEFDIPLVHGGISWSGWQAAILTKQTPCVNCLFPPSVQESEQNAITSCIAKPESSVVYTGQMCGAFMTNLVRSILMPLPSDKNSEGVIFKYDGSLTQPFYSEKLQYRSDCDDCLPLLEDIYPELFTRAQELLKKDEVDLSNITLLN